MENLKIPVLVIVGPTASGKTSLSIECAKKLNGEIVSADSMQIYKGMDIATAKPTKDEMQGVVHHLLSFVNPLNSSYSVADYVIDANRAISDINSRGKLPIIVGGTGLYIDSLIDNIQFTEIQTDQNLRKELEEKLEKIGSNEMLKELEVFDKEAAQRLHPNNKKRIIRAFEVYILTGKTLTQTIKNSKNVASPFDAKFIGINYKNRQILYDRINTRVDLMIEKGLLDEAKQYRDKLSKTSAAAIGYKELEPYFNGELSLENALSNLKQVTRNYAKRQITWFNKNERINWIYPDEENYNIESIIKMIGA
ncbi:MAG: tRNA (adenosine(37)-N6)-dimethylallyltransferase MiaA [Oscillospiraceae bacterium]